MNAMVKEFIETAQQLNHHERLQVKAALEKLDGPEKVCELLEDHWDHQPFCPHCESSLIYRHGLANGLQRYRCRDCGKTFNSLTGTPLSHLHKKALWLDYMECMLQSRTIRDSAGEVGVCTRTAFRWRHRFTELLKDDQADLLGGIVEADETYFRESQKGSRGLSRPPHRRGGDHARPGLSAEQICVLTVQDRAQNGLEQVAGKGPISGVALHNLLAGHIAKDAVLVSDGAAAYVQLCRCLQLEQVVVHNRSGERCRRGFHLQHVNSLHSRLKSWINGHFRGVASKYLNHYLWWKHELEVQKISSAEQLLLASMGNFHRIS